MLRFMRLQKGLKQSELSKKTNIASSTIANYENNTRAITLNTANHIAKACGFEIIFRDKSNNKTYTFDDVKRVSYDKRIRNTRTKK